MYGCLNALNMVEGPYIDKTMLTNALLFYPLSEWIKHSRV
jgi:hypothetical protein